MPVSSFATRRGRSFLDFARSSGERVLRESLQSHFYRFPICSGEKEERDKNNAKQEEVRFCSLRVALCSAASVLPFSFSS